jgi:hypothetical protein
MCTPPAFASKSDEVNITIALPAGVVAVAVSTIFGTSPPFLPFTTLLCQ